MNLEMIFQLVLAICGAIVTIAVIPLIKKKIDAEKIKETLEMVDVAVSAAEQIFRTKGQGEKKKKYVLNKLNKYGIDLDEDKLNMMIEASVNELNSWKNELIK